MPIKDEKQKQKQPDGKRGKYGPSDDSGGGGGGKPKEPGRRPEPAEAKFLKNRHMDQVEGLSLLAVRPAEFEISVSINFVVKLDPTNLCMVSPGGPGDNALVSRFRGNTGEFVGSSSDSQSLTNASGLDFFAFLF